MHRSGTSLLAEILCNNGVSIGSNLVGKTSFNVDGHFEDRFILGINKRILLYFNGTWDQPPQLSKNWLTDNYVLRLMNEAKRYRHEEIDRYERFLFKDPRTCLLLPFWRLAFGKMLYVVILREPKSVIQSIIHRNREWLKASNFWWRWVRCLYHTYLGAYEKVAYITSPQAQRLWKLYYDSVIRDTQGEEVTAVIYERLVAEPEAEIGRLMQRIHVKSRPFNVDMVKANLNHSSNVGESALIRSYYQRLGGR